MASPLSHPRVGLVVPKRGRTAVDRNRVKRRLRELARLHVLPELSGVDLVIRVRDEAYDAAFADLHRDLLQAVQRVERFL